MRYCASRALALCALLLTGCASHQLDRQDAQRLIESSAGFQAPNVLHVRSRYCAPPSTTTDNPAYGLAQLLALEGTGAIHIEHRPAAADECTTLPGDREVLLISLTDVGGNFHPTVLERGAGWDFVLAHRRFLSVAEITFNNPDEPTIAHVLYRWAWRAELVGQLMQLSETPLNAQASFTRADGEWKLRDPGV